VHYFLAQALDHQLPLLGHLPPATEAMVARITEWLDTDYDLYKVINKRPGYSIYELAKLMGWSSGKVYGSVQRLEKEGLVHTEKDI
jgi:predicted transcriptional regulator